jgi:site-specific DNA-methyltransferase (adenine-specific)
MEYLIKLITPPGGIVLDLFAGSGSTLVAAVNLGFRFIGIEKEEPYRVISEARIKATQKKKAAEPKPNGELFG